MRNKIKNEIGCFININTSELINFLRDELRYVINEFKPLAKEDSICTTKDDGTVFITDYEDNKSFNTSKEGKNYIDCKTNIELFKSLAALNKANDYMQWFTDSDNDIWVLCTKQSWDSYIESFPPYKTLHKASKDELIEHFSNNIESCKFTWYPENAKRFQAEFDSIEEALANAKQEFKNSEGDFYKCNGKYSPRIYIGKVINLPYNGISSVCLDLIYDCISVYSEYFNIYSKLETICKFKDENKEEVINNMEQFIRTNFYIDPNQQCIKFNGVYDLLLEKWIEEKK